MASKRPGSVHFTGEITQTDWPTLFDKATQGTLNVVGSIMAKRMQDEVRQHESSGLLTNSITWQTAATGSDVSSPASENDKIPKPTAKNEVHIGSNARHAKYRETGAGPHSNPEGHEEFIANLKDWFRREIGLDPDGPPEERGRFWALVKHVRDDGLPGFPYVEPLRDEGRIILNETFAKELRKAIKTYAKKRG